MKQIENISLEKKQKFKRNLLVHYEKIRNEIAENSDVSLEKKNCWIINYLHDFDGESRSPATMSKKCSYEEKK